MKAQTTTTRPPDYRAGPLVREENAAPLSERELQALWFEQLFRNPLRTDDGREVEIVQPGFWNHGAGPDFHRAAVRFSDTSDGAVTVGSVEVHFRPEDWNAHRHDQDPAYDETVLHVVWEAGRAFFPATSSFRRVPQVILGRQVVAPWFELRPLCRSLEQAPLPGALPGRCAAELSALASGQAAEILRTAGLHRLQLKARRWHWRAETSSREQALWEALAEALGYHANRSIMRLLAQRLPWKMLRRLELEPRRAHLFGLAGFLPDESAARLQPAPRAWLRELWETWWKARGALDHALLARSQWRLAGIRPLNRPERRLAALAQIIPLIPALLKAVEARDEEAFSSRLMEVRDPFWEPRATLTGPVLRASCRLLGEERVRDILLNVFWPMVSLGDAAAARAGLARLKISSNEIARLASQRTLVATLTPAQRREALVQQGLLQVFRDYCLTDCSQCRDCTFPELVRGWFPTASSGRPD